MSAPVRAVEPGPESELVALNNVWIEAEVHHDRAVLERLLDERFLATYSWGLTIDRTAFINRILSREIKPFEVVNDAIIVHGNTALVISTSADHTVKFTYVAIKKEGQWKVISETFTKIAPPPNPSPAPTPGGASHH